MIVSRSNLNPASSTDLNLKFKSTQKLRNLKCSPLQICPNHKNQVSQYSHSQKHDQGNTRRFHFKHLTFTNVRICGATKDLHCKAVVLQKSSEKWTCLTNFVIWCVFPKICMITSRYLIAHDTHFKCCVSVCTARQRATICLDKNYV